MPHTTGGFRFSSIHKISILMKKIPFILFLFFIQIYTFSQTGCISGDCSQGTGTFIWENGDSYSGAWINGSRTGYGIYSWSSGAYYKGEFKDNLLHGYGSYYDGSGNNMIGWFVENNYQGSEKPASFDANYSEDSHNSDEEMSTEDYFEEIGNMLAESDAIKQKALAAANYESFEQVMGKVIKDFPQNFANLKGYKDVSLFDLGDMYYSNLMIAGTDDAMLIQATLSDNLIWYNVVYADDDFTKAKAKYTSLINQFNANVKPECCNLTYNKYEDYKTDSYESYGSYWVPLSIKDNFSDSYSDMMVEIELTTSTSGPKYQVIARVTHLSDK